MTEDSTVQTVLVLHPVNYHQVNPPPSQLIQNMNNLSFTPPIAIPKPINLPSDICTISSGIGNFSKPSPAFPDCGMGFKTDYQGMSSIGGEFQASASSLNNLGANHNMSMPNYPPAPDHVTYSQYHNGSIFSVPKSWPRNNKEDLVVTVYGLVKTLLGASGTSHGAIDNRIEQAMDLVKSHLMNAVRSEVEELKEKIIRLEDTIINLQGENEVLKRNVPADVLRQISSTPNPLLAVQHQPIASTVAVNQIVQQSLSAPQQTASSVIANTTATTSVPVSTYATNQGSQQAINSANAPSANTGLNPGMLNSSSPSQMQPTYMPQANGPQVAAANSQGSQINPTQ